MGFTRIKYQSDANGIYMMKISTDKAGLAGDEAVSGAVTDPNVEVIVSGSKRKYGLKPRGVRFSREVVATGGDTFRKYIFIPCANKATQTALLAETTITYKTLEYKDPISVSES